MKRLIPLIAIAAVLAVSASADAGGNRFRGRFVINGGQALFVPGVQEQLIVQQQPLLMQQQVLVQPQFETFGLAADPFIGVGGLGLNGFGLGGFGFNGIGGRGIGINRGLGGRGLYGAGIGARGLGFRGGRR